MKKQRPPVAPEITNLVGNYEAANSDVPMSNSAALDLMADGQQSSMVTPALGAIGGTEHVASIFFRTDSAAFGPDDLSVLDAVAEAYKPVMKAAGAGDVFCDGFADMTGPEAHNDELSAKRAAVVAGALGARFPYPPRIEANAHGEDAAGPHSMGLDRRVDVTVRFDHYDDIMIQERQEAKEDLPQMLAQANPLLQRRGGPSNERTARLLTLPGNDDLYFTEGVVDQYVVGCLYQIGIRPEEVGSHARIDAVNAVRQSGGDVDKFADIMVKLDEAIFAGIEEVNKYQQIDADTNLSARYLNDWHRQRQRDPNNIIYAHRE